MSDPVTFDRAAVAVPAGKVPRIRRKRARRRRGLTSLAFVTPLLVLLGAFLLYPIYSAIDLSFRSAKAFSTVQAPFVGWANYRSLLDDPDFGALMWHSFIRGFGGAIPSYLVGLAAALALKVRRRGIAILRVIALIPFVLSTPIAVYTWLQLLDPHFGFLGTRFGNNLLGDPDTVWPALLTINTWFSFQFYTILLLAALQRIPSELYEAAQVDGANALQRFLHVTVPGIARVSLVFVGIHFMLSFQEVNLVLVATGGGPANATQTIATYAYFSGFHSFNFGFAAAVSIVSCLVMFATVAVVVVVLFALLWLVRLARRSIILTRSVPSGSSGTDRTSDGRSVPVPRRSARRDRWRIPARLRSPLAYLPAAASALAGVVPLIFLLSQSFDGQPAGSQKMALFPRQPTFDNYIRVLGNPQLRSPTGDVLPPLFLNFLSSILVAALVTVLVLVISGPAGYGLSRASGRWARLLTAVILIVQFIPPVLLVFPLYHELNLLDLLDSRFGLALVTSVLIMPLSTLLFKTFFDTGTRELEEAASLDGANAFRIFRSVVVPTSRPVLGTVAAFTLITSWNEFLFSLTFLNDSATRTLPSALYLFTSTQEYAAQTPPGQQAVYLVVPALLAVMLLALTQRHFTAAYQGGGVKG